MDIAGTDMDISTRTLSLFPVLRFGLYCEGGPSLFLCAAIVSSRWRRGNTTPASCADERLRMQSAKETTDFIILDCEWGIDTAPDENNELSEAVSVGAQGVYNVVCVLARRRGWLAASRFIMSFLRCLERKSFPPT